MTAFDDFSASQLRTRPSGPSVELRSGPLAPTPTFSIVIPALNEEASLPVLINQIELSLRGQFYEVVFVDDGSDDNTWNVIQSAVRRHRNWQAIRLTRRFGHQAALSAGIRAARGRAVIMMDADGQHPPELIPAMVERWRDGAKVVQMIRGDASGASIFKRATSAIFYRIFSSLSEVSIKPSSSDFRLLDRSVVDLINREDGQVPFLRGLVPWLGCRTEEISYQPKPRLGGKTKYSLFRMMSLATHGVMNFSIMPLRLATYAGLAFATLSFAYLCYIAWIGIYSPAAVSGWASTAGLIALLGGVQLICVGLLGEYLGRLFTAQLGRPPFVVAERCGASGRDRPIHEPESDILRINSSLRKSESVRLVTAHIGADEAEEVIPEKPDRLVASRIVAMRREELEFAPTTT